MKSLISFLKVLSIILIISEFAKVESKFFLKFKQPQSCPKNTNFFFDDSNCGTCGTKCGLSTRCHLGSCVCTEGLKNCENTCVDNLTNPEHCGKCGTKCTLKDEICSAGTCACRKDYSKCSNGCFDLKFDEQNCGECGKVCETGYDCINGGCVIQTGAKLCDNVIKIINSDSENCGDCGVKCSAEQACVNGKCDCPLIKNRKTISYPPSNAGTPFEDTIPADTGCKKWSINKINFKSGAWIDNIILSLTDSKGNDFPIKGIIRGGNGGSEKDPIYLNENPIDKIIIYKAERNQYVSGIKFVGTNNLTYELGNVSTDEFQVIQLEEGERIIGTYGRAGGFIDSIGFIVYK
jgi:hypothetical protein